MKIQCPFCSAIFNAPDEYENRKGKCIKCGQSFLIKKLQSHKYSTDLSEQSIPKNSSTNLQQAPEEKQKTIDVRLIPTKFRLLINKNERVFYASTPSIGALLLNLLIPVLLIICHITIFFVTSIGFPETIIISFFLLGWCLLVFFSWKNRYYVITEKRTLVSVGIFNIKVGMIPNKNIQMIYINTGIIDRLLGLNTIEISSAANSGGINIFKKNGTLEFKSINNVHIITQLYHNLI